jgi:hypothetical protein
VTDAADGIFGRTDPDHPISSSAFTAEGNVLTQAGRKSAEFEELHQALIAELTPTGALEGATFYRNLRS